MTKPALGEFTSGVRSSEARQLRTPAWTVMESSSKRASEQAPAHPPACLRLAQGGAQAQLWVDRRRTSECVLVVVVVVVLGRDRRAGLEVVCAYAAECAVCLASPPIGKQGSSPRGGGERGQKNTGGRPTAQHCK